MADGPWAVSGCSAAGAMEGVTATAMAAVVVVVTAVAAAVAVGVVAVAEEAVGADRSEQSSCLTQLGVARGVACPEAGLIG